MELREECPVAVGQKFEEIAATQAWKLGAVPEVVATGQELIEVAHQDPLDRAGAEGDVIQVDLELCVHERDLIDHDDVSAGASLADVLVGEVVEGVTACNIRGNVGLRDHLDLEPLFAK